MAYKLQLKRGVLASLPNGSVGEPLFTTDTFDLYVGKGDGTNVKIQKFIASGSSSQFLKGDGSLDSNTYIGLTALSASAPLSYNNTTGAFTISQAGGSTNGYLSSGDWTTFNAKQAALSGSGIVKSTGGTISYLTDNSANWDSAYNDKINSASVSGTTTKTLTLTQQDGGTITASWSDYDTAPVTSVFGRTGVVVAASGDYTTSLVTEGTNLYFTDARARAAITLTTTGSSGSATYVGGTLNVPTYTLAGLGGVPTSRSLTINGTSYDLSADRSWSVGTVTSVDLSVPTGFAISGNPITSSGTLALAFATGYSLPTTASQTNWDAAYNDKINSASVTGTTTKTLTLNQQDGGTITASWTDINTDAVTSVFGRTGAVVAASGDYTTTQVTEGTNLYYTDARSRAALSFVAGSGAYNSTTGVITIPTNTNQLTNGAAFITLGSLSASAPLSYNNGTGAFTISQASSTTNGFLSSTDWNTFNNKQNALTNPVTGTGTTNYIPKWTSGSALGNSLVYDNGTTIALGNTANGTGYALEFNNNASTPRIDLVDNGTYTGFLKTNGLLVSVGNNSANAFTINTAGTEKMRITSGGNLLVGTTTDNGSRLQVTGAATFSNSVTSSGGIFIAQPSTGTNSAYSGYLNNGGQLYVGIDDSTGSTFGKGVYAYNIYGNANRSMVFSTDGTARLTILGTGAATFSSSVTVTGSLNVGSSGSLSINAGSAATPLIKQTSTYTELYKQGGGVAIYLGGTGDPANYYYNDTHYFSSAGGGTNYAIITSQGRLGIGTTSPSVRFEVNNTINTTYSSSNTLAGGVISYIKNTSTTNSTDATIRLEATGAGNLAATSISAVHTGTGSSALTFGTRLNSGDVTERMRIDSSGNLGLGVTPTSGVGDVKHFEIESGGRFVAAGNNAEVGANYYYDSAYKYITSNAVTRFEMNGGAFRFYTAPSGTAGNAISFTQAMTLNASGQLLIGTTSAQSGTRLQVAGFLDVWSSANTLLRLNHDGTRGIIETFTGGGYAPTSINPNGGNVLIGTTTDAGYKLDVNGTINGATVQTTSRFIVNSTSNAGVSDISFGSYANGSWLNTPSGTIGYLSVGGTAAYSYSNTQHIWYTNTGTERMRLDASGNLGLGVTPSAWGSGGKLQVGSGQTIGSVGNGFVLASNWYYNAGDKFAGTGYASYYYQQGGTHTWNTSTTSGNVGDTATMTQAMTLDASGRLGIGTTSPDVYGVHAYNASNSVYFKAVSGGVSTFYGSATALGIGLLGTISNNDLAIWTNSSEKLRVTSGGNVLVGTTTDAGIKLDVAGSIRAGGILYSRQANYPQIVFQETTSSTDALIFYDNVAATKNMGFRVNSGSNVMTLTSSNVGIGTTSPSALLHTYVSTGSVRTLTETGNSSSSAFTAKNSTQATDYGTDSIGGFIQTQGAYPLLIYTNSIERMRITSGGNLLVGTTTDSGEKLVVNGDAAILVDLKLKRTSVSPAIVLSQSQVRLVDESTGYTNSIYTENNKIRFSNSIQTAAPTGYTAQPWKLGDATSGTITPNYYIKVEINGQIYSIPALQGTP